MGEDAITIKDPITTADAAEILGVTKQGVINAVLRSRIVGQKFGKGKGGSWIVSRASVLAYKQTRGPGARTEETEENTNS